MKLFIILTISASFLIGRYDAKAISKELEAVVIKSEWSLLDSQKSSAVPEVKVIDINESVQKRFGVSKLTEGSIEEASKTTQDKVKDPSKSVQDEVKEPSKSEEKPHESSSQPPEEVLIKLNSKPEDEGLKFVIINMDGLPLPGTQKNAAFTADECATGMVKFNNMCQKGV